TIRVQAAQDVAWCDFDNVGFITEEIVWGDFEGLDQGPWSLSNGASTTNVAPIAGEASLRLPPGSEASLVVAHSPFTAEYFIAGSASDPCHLGVERLTGAGVTADGSTSSTVVLDGTGRFFLEPPLSPNAEAARLYVQNTGSAGVLLDDLSRGWAYVFPKIFEP